MVNLHLICIDCVSDSFFGRSALTKKRQIMMTQTQTLMIEQLLLGINDCGLIQLLSAGDQESGCRGNKSRETQISFYTLTLSAHSSASNCQELHSSFSDFRVLPKDLFLVGCTRKPPDKKKNSTESFIWRWIPLEVEQLIFLRLRTMASDSKDRPSIEFGTNSKLPLFAFRWKSPIKEPVAFPLPNRSRVITSSKHCNVAVY